MKKFRRMAALVAALAMSASVSVTALAATNTYTYIDKVSLDIIHDIEIDEYDCDADAIVSSAANYDVEYAKITNEPDEAWEDGDKPKVSVVLYVKDDSEYRFASGIKKTDVTLIDPKDGKVTSITRGDSGRKLTVKVELPKLEHEAGYYEDALVVEGVEFDSDTGMGYWEENEYADRYEVKIYRNDAYVGGVFKTTELDYDFSKYFTRKGDYYFSVRGVRDKKGSSDDYKSEWTDSEEFYVEYEEAKEIRLYGGYGDSKADSETTTVTGNGPTSSSKNNTATYNGPLGKTESVTGGWMQNANGWWWCNPDRTYPANTWKEINGLWYYFDQNGYCLMNSWIQSKESGLWYYCGETGAMWTSRRTPDGYYVDSTGAWIQ